MPPPLLFAVQLAAALLSARLLGRLAVRLGQPAVLGELLAGVALGALPFFGRGHPWMHLLAQAGVVLLLLETGLHCHPKRLLASGGAATAVACVGVAAPFALGWAAMRAFGFDGRPAVYVGAALTATSVGITARLLADLGREDSPEGRVILGAAVVDDVIGVLILAALGGSSLESVLVVAAFALGAALKAAGRSARLERAALPAASVLAPVFFVMTGSAVDLGALSPSMLGLAALLTSVAAAGKFASGLAAGPGVRRWAVGVGMLPRGEVGLLFASIGLSAGAFEAPLYGALVATVLATTLLAPPLLRRALD